jgi:hypothetical protein
MRSEEVNVAGPRSESRRLTELVAVRFTESDKLALENLATEIGVKTPELLREAGLALLRSGRVDAIRAAS